jgi:hypothetical protein
MYFGGVDSHLIASSLGAYHQVFQVNTQSFLREIPWQQVFPVHFNFQGIIFLANYTCELVSPSFECTVALAQRVSGICA